MPERICHTPEWWRGCVIYQIYPRSFCDNNGDGIGDLPGITNNLDYVARLGVDAIWISPFFTSPMRDFGYDVSDYRGVDPIFGTLRDFDDLLAEAHRLGLKVIIDQVISHSSDRHPWFGESRRDRGNPRADWYVWADPKPDGTPPNNWLSVFGGPAWKWDTGRMQYYLHNFLDSQPDLNFHNPGVRREVLDILRFWLDRGVDGFRLDTVNYYFHDRELRDNPALPSGFMVATAPRSNPYSFQDHVYDKTRPENLAFLEEARRLTDTYHPRRMLVGELGVDLNVGATLAAYTEKGRRLHMAYVFDLLTEQFSAAHIIETATRLDREIGQGWMCWSFSNHDVPRVISRWGLERHADRVAPLLWALLLSLRGSVCVYQGEELGIGEAEIPRECIRDPYGIAMWPEFKGRDGCRTPMPWQGSDDNAGFSDGTPWLPIPPEHTRLAMDVQEKNPASVLNRCRGFTEWRRRQPLLLHGDMDFPDAPGDVVLLRRAEGGKELLAAFNLGEEARRFALPGTGWRLAAGHGFGGRLEDGAAALEGFDALFVER